MVTIILDIINGCCVTLFEVSCDCDAFFFYHLYCFFKEKYALKYAARMEYFHL